MKSDLLITINKEKRCTYRNNRLKDNWNTWKTWNSLSQEEKEKVNLAIPTDDYIIFDIDLHTENEKEILENYNSFKDRLKQLRIQNYVADRSRAGFHVFAKFRNLADMDEKIQKEIRKIYIKKLGCDLAKSSMEGVISLPGRPHFKTGESYNVIESNPGENELLLIYIEQAKHLIKKREEKSIDDLRTPIFEANLDFKDFFEKDKFFNYLKDNIIPDNCKRNSEIFPSLAIASYNTGKSIQEIRKIVEPVILENMPGKIWAEFEGWLNKAFKGEIEGYNPILLNNWAKEHLGEENFFYDLKSQSIQELDLSEEKILKESSNDSKKNKFSFFWDSQLGDVDTENTEWLIDQWLPKGDICFIAGKASSYKSTTCAHMAYAISQGKMIFSKYPTKKEKVLYLNEENSKQVMLGIIRRIKKGLELEDVLSENIAFSFLEGMRLDLSNDVYELISFIRANDIQVLFCDSFRRFIGFDENSATEMNALFNNLKTIRKCCSGLTIIFLHHHKKGGTGAYEDPRDMLRGSSDIVNSADSVIGIQRKHGSKAFKMFHIKNRSGEEIEERIIKIDGEKEGKAYFYETDRDKDQTLTLRAEENCAGIILAEIEKKKQSSYSRKDFDSVLSEFSYDVITKSFRILITEGSIYKVGSGTKTRYAMV